MRLNHTNAISRLRSRTVKLATTKKRLRNSEAKGRQARARIHALEDYVKVLQDMLCAKRVTPELMTKAGEAFDKMNQTPNPYKR